MLLFFSLSLVLHIVKERGEALLTHYIYYCYLLPVSFNILPQDIWSNYNWELTWKLEITASASLLNVKCCIILSPIFLVKWRFLFFCCKLCISKLLVSELDKTHMGIFTTTSKQCGCNDEKHWKLSHHRQIKKWQNTKK